MYYCNENKNLINNIYAFYSICCKINVFIKWILNIKWIFREFVVRCLYD